MAPIGPCFSTDFCIFPHTQSYSPCAILASGLSTFRLSDISILSYWARPFHISVKHSHHSHRSIISYLSNTARVRAAMSPVEGSKSRQRIFLSICSEIPWTISVPLRYRPSQYGRYPLLLAHPAVHLFSPVLSHLLR